MGGRWWRWLSAVLAAICGLIFGFVAGFGVARAAGTMPPAAALIRVASPPPARLQPAPTPWAANQASSRAHPSSAASLRSLGR
jgi:hypothetical protein